MDIRILSSKDGYGSKWNSLSPFNEFQSYLYIRIIWNRNVLALFHQRLWDFVKELAIACSINLFRNQINFADFHNYYTCFVHYSVSQWYCDGLAAFGRGEKVQLGLCGILCVCVCAYVIRHFIPNLLLFCYLLGATCVCLSNAIFFPSSVYTSIGRSTGASRNHAIR